MQVIHRGLPHGTLLPKGLSAGPMENAFRLKRTSFRLGALRGITWTRWSIKFKCLLLFRILLISIACFLASTKPGHMCRSSKLCVKVRCLRLSCCSPMILALPGPYQWFDPPFSCHMMKTRKMTSVHPVVETEYRRHWYNGGNGWLTSKWYWRKYDEDDGW